MISRLSAYFLFIYLIFISPIFADSNSKEADGEIYQLEEISVTPGRFSISDSAQSPYIMPKEQMEKLPLIDNDIYRAAHSLPGVVADDFSARFSLRGGDRDETVVRLDGMELYDPYHLQDFTKPVAIIVGTEATGLSEVWLENADERIIIPMSGSIDSLNVSVSAAILIFEAKSQRDFKF